MRWKFLRIYLRVIPGRAKQDKKLYILPEKIQMTDIDIKLAFVISLSVHFFFFLILTISSKSNSKIYYIPIQVISTSYGGPAAAEPKTKTETIKSGEISVGKPILKRKKKAKTIPQPEKNVTENKTGNGSGAVNEIGVNAGNFPYMGYVNILRNKIAETWNPAPYPSSSPKKVTVYFRILRDGRVDNITIKESAGVSYIDRSAIRAISNSGPFPPLPAGYTDDYLGVYFMFELSGN